MLIKRRLLHFAMLMKERLGYETDRRVIIIV